jgi:Rod binding domain-containing protein
MSDPITAILPMTVPAERVDFQRTQRLTSGDGGTNERIRDAKLRKASQDFESLFMYKLLKSMRATVPEGEETGFGMETMREITDEQMAVYLAQQGGIGLGDILYQSLQRQTQQAETVDTAATHDDAGELTINPVSEMPHRSERSLKILQTEIPLIKATIPARAGTDK